MLANFALNEPPPDTVATNLIDAEKNFPEMTVAWKPIDVKELRLRLGVVSVSVPVIPPTRAPALAIPVP